ncbi:hypothetical protein Desaci_4545 [Desulfosporosinus acidiphilus SJ4]|uniref:Uncharacterized protein n=1 Tax=Desulfosporosinus acidiphilus (strain DSM 22704 / JCM 16185 / SJ4) TaxID=646529 RepID=I4DC61_DESAJ|nr:hypothetical protein Desaci_4545 [Desulfosporosinus acidiphilus SJ4]
MKYIIVDPDRQNGMELKKIWLWIIGFSGNLYNIQRGGKK